MQHIIIIILLLHPFILRTQITQEQYVQSQGATIEQTTATISHTAIVGEPISSGAVSHSIFEGSSIGFLSTAANNQVAIANAGIDQSVLSGATIQLDGTASTGTALTFQWTSLDGVNLNDASSAQPTFTAPNTPVSQSYLFKLTVTDEQTMDMDTVKITVSSQDWHVTPLSNSTSLVARVQIDGNEAAVGDLVGAFVDDTARGVGEIFLFNSQAFVTMTIQAENQETVSFKVYDMSADQVCTASAILGIIPGQTIGNPTNPHLIIATCSSESSCDENLLNLDDDPIEDGTYKASNTITSSGKIVANSTVTFKAGTSITLQPGFHAKSAANFFAIIEVCASSLLESQSRNSTIVATAFLAEKTSNIEFSIQPNPFTTETSIIFQLPKTMLLDVAIHDLTGQLIQEFQKQHKMEKGQNEIILTANGLSSGMYHLVVKGADFITSKKVIIVK